MQTLITPSGAILRDPDLQPPLKLVAFGDSVVYGHGDPDGGGWVERLRRRWMHPHHAGPVLYNLGVRGDGIVQVNQRFASEFSSRGELRNRQPDGVILSFGVNDSARLGHPQGRHFTPLDTFRGELRSLLENARQASEVWFVGMVPVDENKMPFLKSFFYSHEDQHQYNAIARSTCEQLQIPYLDVWTQWLHRGEGWWRSRLSDDGLHPNVDGHKALFDAVLAWDALAQLI